MYTKYIEAKDNDGNVKGGEEFSFPSDLDEAIEEYGAGPVYKHFMDAFVIHTRSVFHKGWAKKASLKEEARKAEARENFRTALAEGKFDEVDEATLAMIKKSIGM